MTRYEIDPGRSTAWIEASSSLHPIHSQNTGLEGFFEADLRDGEMVNLSEPVRGHVELPVERLQSGNPLYDREMKRRVDSRRYPAIVGDLSAMKDAGDGGRYLVAGDVTLKGVTRTYEDEMTLTSPREGTVCLEGEHLFDIRDFGMEPPKIMMLKVHPEVSVRVQIVAVREG